MRRALLLALPLVIGGCGKNVFGWWELTRWEVTRDGETLVCQDAGTVVWQDVPYGSFHMILSYAYDPTAFELVPLSEPEVSTAGPHPDDIELGNDSGPDLTLGGYSFDVETLRGSRMVLVSSDPLVDGAEFLWQLER